jgi:hypothetical protein
MLDHDTFFHAGIIAQDVRGWTGSGKAAGNHTQGEATSGIDAQPQERKKVKNKIDNVSVSGRHLGAGRPASLPPPGVPRPCTYEPCDDVDTMPDYENVLTD